jgi:hypothetical protein
LKHICQTSNYPGHQAHVDEIIELANAYYAAALDLFKSNQSQSQLSYAPARLCSIHAIELYLNAFLRYHGVPPEEIRGRMHNLADPKFVTVLKLKKKTATHLAAMTEKREYLISRYAPELACQHTELNRLTATLVEVMTKVSQHLNRQ